MSGKNGKLIAALELYLIKKMLILILIFPTV